MEHKHVIVSGVILIALIAGMFIFAYIKSKEIEQKAELPITSETNEQSPYDDILRIDAKHFFKDGMHTIVGEILMPTPCDLLNWDTRIAESYPEQVTVDFSVVNNTTSCTQVVTAQRFKVAFSASENATIRAMLQGRVLDINLIPGSPGETPEDFELFIKG